MKNFTGNAEPATVFCEPLDRLRLIGLLEKKTVHSSLLSVLFPTTLVSLFTSIFQFLLNPLGQIIFVSRMLAAIAIGPSCLGRNEKIRRKMFSPRNMMVFNVFESLGVYYVIFLVSVRTDVSIVKKSGRLAIIIGIGAFVIPMVVTTVMALLIRDAIELDEQHYDSLPATATLQSQTSFCVIFTLLTDLKLLNSELGRLALSSSMVSNLVGFIFLAGIAYVKDSSKLSFKDIALMNLSDAMVIGIIVFAIRPLMLWMMKKTPEGKSLKHDHVLAINIIVLCILFVGEITGQHGLLGPVLMGIMTPDRPPMGSRLATRIEYFIWAVFMPCYLLNIGKHINFFSIELNTFLAVEFLISAVTAVKFFSVVIPSLYYKIPFMDALSLGLVLNCRGIYDMPFFSRAHHVRAITDEMFGIFVMSAILQSAIIVPLVRVSYDSSRRYVAYRRRTIQHSEQYAELRILACIHEEEHVSTIINILHASNPRHRPVGLYVLNLEEYVGLSMPLVIPHRLDIKPSSSKPTIVDTMITSFRHFERRHKGVISVQCFTSIAPYASMHDDICSMAFEKDISLVIIPFSKTNNLFVKTVIKQVIKMAPCSVGILYDRGIFTDSRPILSRQLSVNVCVVFIGGPDDRETLAYGQRMAEKNSILLTVIRLIAVYHSTNDLIERKHDLHTIDHFRINTINNKNVDYFERSVLEGADTAVLLNSISNDFDLILVGRRHDDQSPVLIGLAEWSEIEELGVIGDLLVSSDFKSKASIMVIQQQASVVDEMIESSKEVIDSSKEFSKRLR